MTATAHETAPVDQQTLREDLCHAVKELAAQGWCQGTGGNFSVTLSREPLRLLLTRSGVHKRYLKPADLMVVGPGGRPADGETAKPSAEARFLAAMTDEVVVGQRPRAGIPGVRNFGEQRRSLEVGEAHLHGPGSSRGRTSSAPL